MTGVDTNVLVRYYVNDNPRQHRTAVHFFDENDVFVNSIVLVETFWVLSSVYHLTKDEIGAIFD